MAPTLSRPTMSILAPGLLLFLAAAAVSTVHSEAVWLRKVIASVDVDVVGDARTKAAKVTLLENGDAREAAALFCTSIHNHSPECTQTLSSALLRRFHERLVSDLRFQFDVTNDQGKTVGTFIYFKDDTPATAVRSFFAAHPKLARTQENVDYLLNTVMQRLAALVEDGPADGKVADHETAKISKFCAERFASNVVGCIQELRHGPKALVVYKPRPDSEAPSSHDMALPQQLAPTDTEQVNAEPETRSTYLYAVGAAFAAFAAFVATTMRGDVDEVVFVDARAVDGEVDKENCSVPSQEKKTPAGKAGMRRRSFGQSIGNSMAAR